MNRPFPLARFLTPSPDGAVPAGFAPVAGDIVTGLPHYLQMSSRLRLKLTAPTGLARQWLDLAADVVVSSSADQAQAFDPAQPTRMLAGQTPRLSIIQDGRVVGSAALTLGRMSRFPANQSAAAVELIVLGWSISAAAVRGPASDGSFIRIAWRAADQAISEFGPPPVSDYVVRRIEPKQRIESQLYRHDRLLYRGHLANSVLLKVRPWA